MATRRPRTPKEFVWVTYDGMDSPVFKTADAARKWAAEMNGDDLEIDEKSSYFTAHGYDFQKVEVLS